VNDGTYKALLKDLQKQEKRIADAHIARVRGDAKEQARLAALHAAAEVGGRAEDYVAMQARKSAVQFLLRTVYVRVLEDLKTLEPVRIRGGWGEDAFRAIAPALGKRAYFEFIFRDLARDFPALFTRGADELDLPAEDLCRDAWALWHKEDGRGNILYDWRPVEADGAAASFDSRFLGDLYQDLDAEVRKRYALLQTPVFVERYILDKTLTPALVEFDPAALRVRGETFRVLDPTCGSGHFLVGAFHRMAAYWEANGLAKWEAAERALESVWGCDINPHAVDIARFRLLLEVRGRTGVNDLNRLAGLTLNLAVLDSLIPWERASSLFPAMDRLAKYATAEERKANADFLGRAFHVVVGNPPYITPKDVQKRDDYRSFWPDSAAGKYALSAPFVERLFVLGAAGAFVGQITANSFMKREFGKRLVGTVLPRWDLTGVVDTSGAYIPGHGTPTVILFGKAQQPKNETVLAILGKRGEPQRPMDGAEERGLVWSAIAASGVEADDTSPFVTVAEVARAAFETHPWSLGGGLAAPLKTDIESSSSVDLSRLATSIGITCFTLADDVFVHGAPYWRRRGVSREACRPMVEGDELRDFMVHSENVASFPYDENLVPHMEPTTYQALWSHRVALGNAKMFGGKSKVDAGLNWFEYGRLTAAKLRVPLSLAFAFVGTHNQFVLDRGGKVFKQTAPVIKLAPAASEHDHLDLLGLLNSSALGFWMKQVSHCKGSSSGEAIRSEDWEPFWEYDSTKLQKAPLTTTDRPARIALAAALDITAQSRAACLPAAILATDWTDLPALLTQARLDYARLTLLMVALQEELDWLTYGSYKLIDPVETVAPDAVEPLARGHRPFEILFARADDDADPDEKSAWWSRHGHHRVTEIPAHYSPAHRARIQARMDLIEADPRLQLLEAPAYKRRWQTPDLAKAEKEAAESWLLDRLEDLFAPKSDQSKHAASGELAEPKPYRLEAVVAAWQRDPRVAAVAGVWTGSGAATDLTLVAEKLLRKNAIPDNPYRVYTADGLYKLGEWKRVWALQDQEDAKVAQLMDPRTNKPLLDDAGKPTNTIPLPPKFDKADFQADYFSTRGKLNVPRERFIAFTDLTPARYGWNGWRDRERALAQVEAYTLAETDPELPLPIPTSADPRRCGPTLGLWESLPDVKRWASADEHAELSSLAQEVCRQPRCPCPVVEKWQAWRRGDLVIGSEGTGATTTVSVEERAMVMALFDKKQTSLLADDAYEELPHDWLIARWKGPADRLAPILDDLIATGDVELKGRGGQQRYARTHERKTGGSK
jgi:hypothetical protein